MNEVFDDLVGSIDPPMYVVTARASDGEPVGCLVGFATQCSIDPPRFLVCVSEQNHTFGPAMVAEHVVVHVLRATDRAVAAQFGAITADDLERGGVDKFARFEVVDGPGGAPVIVGLDWFGGRVLERTDCGDHWAMVLEPVSGDASRAAERQLGLQDTAGFRAGHPDS